MPIRRRTSKRRFEPEQLAKVWCGILESGFDFFDEAEGLGIATDHVGRPDREAARAAWAQWGSGIVAERDPQLGPAWGEREFGPPGAR